MTDLNMDMFAFLSWLERNKEAHSLDGLTMSDGYKWYDYMWKCWLENSDAGKRTLNHKPYNQNRSGEITWWGGNPDMNNTVTDNNSDFIVDTRTTGETTIQFPKPYQPEQYNPNRPSLDTMTFRFEQDENCVDGSCGGEGETLTVEAKSSLGIDGDGGAFYVLKTEQWAISDIDDMIVMLKRVEAALNAVKPTSIHVK